MRNQGFSLVELMAATAILTLLSVMAVPYAQTAKDREQEVQLIDSLTRIRDAIQLYAWNEPNGDQDGDGVEEEDPSGDPDGDGFFDDDRDGKVDEDGYPNYPQSLQELVTRGYLASIPPDPFRPLGAGNDWAVIRITRTATWNDGSPRSSTPVVNGIVDVRSKSPGTSLRGDRYDTW